MKCSIEALVNNDKHAVAELLLTPENEEEQQLLLKLDRAELLSSSVQRDDGIESAVIDLHKGHGANSSHSCQCG